MDTTADTPIISDEEDAVRNKEEIGEVNEVVGAIVIWHTSVELKECVIIQANTEGSQKKAKIRTCYTATRYLEASRTVPDRLGSYLQVSLIQKKLKHLIHQNYYVALLYTHLNT